MNQTIQDLYNRKSVRVFTDEPITDDEKNIILNSALQAPTAGNMTLYSILDIREQSLKEELAKRCDNQPFIAKAPLVLIFLADFQKWYDIFKAYCEEPPKIEEADLFLASQDCVIAAQNAVVAAQSMGIGSCYIGDIMESFEINRELLQLPKYALPYSMVVFGRPTQQQKDRIKPKRFELDDIVHTDIYHHKSLEETKNMLEKQSGKTGKEFEEYITAFAKRKFYVDFRREMNRSAKAMLKQWTD
jgi:FMN reductase (NADPH)